MEVYRSEEEQIEAIKKWWKENGRSVILGIAFGGAIVVGWGIWQSNQQTKAEQGSDLYQQLVTAVQDKESESALKLSERLIDRYGRTSYAVYANFFIAKLQTEKGDLSAAKKALETILESGADENYNHIARLRLIRLLAASGDLDGGLKMIAATDIARSGKFEGSYEELRGDLFVALEKDSEARTAYQRAQQIGVPSPYLQLKLDDVETLKTPELSP